MERRNRFPIYIEPQVVLIAAILLVCVPLPWIIAWLFASAIHEVCHCLAVIAFNGRIDGVKIDTNGAILHTNLNAPSKELICLLSGPVGAGMLVLLSSRFPRLAVCALIQSAYNLLPFSNLDGGQVLVRLLRLVFPSDISDQICIITERLVLTSVICMCIIGFVWLKLGFFPIIIAGIFLAKHGRINYSCKWGDHRVQ